MAVFTERVYTIYIMTEFGYQETNKTVQDVYGRDTVSNQDRSDYSDYLWNIYSRSRAKTREYVTLLLFHIALDKAVREVQK